MECDKNDLPFVGDLFLHGKEIFMTRKMRRRRFCGGEADGDSRTLLQYLSEF
jgi:hypothetical protein